jgi:hypothetical protein
MTTLAVGTRWFLWSEDVGTEVVNILIFFDFVDGRRQILVQDSTGTSPVDVPHRHVARYAATCLFIDS